MVKRSLKSGFTGVLILVFLGVLSRTIFHLGPNVEFVTGSIILASVYLGRRWAMLVALCTLFISDLILGNTFIFIFTWSAYLMLAFCASLLMKNKKKNESSLNLTLRAGATGVASSIWFFLWTNFGVWLLDSMGMYEKTLTGLIRSYLMGIPFLKYNLIGNLLFVPVSVFIVETFRKNLSANSNYSWQKKLKSL